MRKLPAGCTITNIKRGKGDRAGTVYATLINPMGEIEISATLDYICSEIGFSEIGGVSDPDAAPE